MQWEYCWVTTGNTITYFTPDGAQNEKMSYDKAIALLGSQGWEWFAAAGGTFMFKRPKP